MFAIVGGRILPISGPAIENGTLAGMGPAVAVTGRPPRLHRSRPPVAVLTSRLTGSSGEGVVMAFRGRPDSRSFGEPTAGVPTGNAPYPLSDRAELHLTEGIGVDRTGATYQARIQPDRVAGRVEMTMSSTRKNCSAFMTAL